SNSGTISGGFAGAVFTGASSDLFFTNKGTFTGNITNTSTGVISGGSYGLQINYDTFEGNFSNAGTITSVTTGGEGSSGTAGVQIDVNTWTGNITNETGATIEGGTTGMRVHVNGTLTGNVTNNGTITAGGGFVGAFVPEFDPGMAVVASSMIGNV